MSLVQEALNYATEQHSGQIRIFGGEEYILHPIAVSSLVRKYIIESTEEELIEIDDMNGEVTEEVLKAAALLHDVAELPSVNHRELVNKFGVTVTYLVLEVTTNREMKEAIGKKKYLAYKLMHMTNWALLIKLCDRLDNMSDYVLWTEEFRERKIDETEFILDYIEENRKLCAIHQRIIADIRLLINKAKEHNREVTPQLKLL